MSEWISVDDSLPERGRIVKVKTEGYNKPRIATYYYKDYQDGFLQEMGWAWVFLDYVPTEKLLTRITHWMALPKPPLAEGDPPSIPATPSQV